MLTFTRCADSWVSGDEQTSIYFINIVTSRLINPLSTFRRIDRSNAPVFPQNAAAMKLRLIIEKRDVRKILIPSNLYAVWVRYSGLSVIWDLL